MSYIALLDAIFSKKRKAGKITFKRELKPQVVVYKWENEFAYTAPFKILSSNLLDEDMICTRIEMKHPEFVKRKEYYLFCEEINSIFNPEITIRTLTYQDEDRLAAMKEECCKEDIDVANISVYEGEVIGAFLNQKLVGVCSCDSFFGMLDLAILVHPDYRRQKIASTLLSISVQKAIDKKGICLYRVDDFNIASYKTASLLGFEKKIEVIFYELEENR